MYTYDHIKIIYRGNLDRVCLKTGGIGIKKLIPSVLMIVAIVGVLALSGCSEKQTTQPESNKAAELPSKYILINHSGTLMSYIGDYNKAGIGNDFLVVDMVIENHGYESFSVAPIYFSVVIDGVEYPYELMATVSLNDVHKSPLNTLKILDGGKVEGSLAFKIPQDKTSYILKYIGYGSYDIIYGDLQKTSTHSETTEAPKLPARTITYDFGNGEKSDTPSNVKSDNGILIQKSHITTENDDGYADVTIKTLQSSGNINQIVNDALKLEKINSIVSQEKGTRGAVLENGDQVKVSIRQNPSVLSGGNKYESVAYSLDPSTAVIIFSTLNSKRTDSLLKSLKVGALENV